MFITTNKFLTFDPYISFRSFSNIFHIYYHFMNYERWTQVLALFEQVIIVRISHVIRLSTSFHSFSISNLSFYILPVVDINYEYVYLLGFIRCLLVLTFHLNRFDNLFSSYRGCPVIEGG